MSMIGYFLLTPPGDVERLLQSPQAADQFVGADGDRALCVEKGWHGLHYLLTQTAWEGAAPLDFIVRGGREVGGDLGYGPARLFEPATMRDLASQLETLLPDEVGGRYDGARMTELDLYPGGWVEGAAEWRAELTELYAGLRTLVLDGARDGMGLLVYLS